MPVTIGVKWGKNSYDVEVDTSGVGLDLKTQLFSLTGVPPERIKLMGLKGGKQLTDDVPLADCGLEDLAAKKKKLMMMGSTAEVIKAPEKEITFVEDLPEEEQEAATMANFSPGLTNLGNTCYMNATIQCLYAVPELRSILNDASTAGGGTPASAPAPGGGTALANATRDLFNEIKNSNAAVTPFRFLALLRQLFPQFAQVGQGGVYSQQDAEECWSSILQTLCREVPAVDKLFGLRLKMSLKNELTGETREEVKREYNFKCNITINVNHLSEGFRVALDEEREYGGEIFKGHNRVCELPPWLNVQMVRFFWKMPGANDPADATGQKAKILRAVTFPVLLDMYEHCTDEYKAALDPARAAKIKKEEADAEERLQADPRARLAAEAAAGTAEAADAAARELEGEGEGEGGGGRIGGRRDGRGLVGFRTGDPAHGILRVARRADAQGAIRGFRALRRVGAEQGRLVDGVRRSPAQSEEAGRHPRAQGWGRPPHGIPPHVQGAVHLKVTRLNVTSRELAPLRVQSTRRAFEITSTILS